MTVFDYMLLVISVPWFCVTFAAWAYINVLTKHTATMRRATLIPSAMILFVIYRTFG